MMNRTRTGLTACTDQAGRTLIELLVGLSITMMASLLLASIVVLGLRISGSFQREDERVYPVRNAFDMIVKDVRLAQGTYPDCGVSGRLALAIHGPGENEIWFAHYSRNASNQLVRTIYRDASCSVKVSEQTLAYQITDFAISAPGAGRFEITLKARSHDAAQTEFEMQQVVIGRMLGQP